MEEVRSLIKAGADTRKATSDGVTPLYIAACGGHAEVVKALLQHGAEMDINTTRNGFPFETPLWVACARDPEDEGVDRDAERARVVEALVVVRGAAPRAEWSDDEASLDNFTELGIAALLGRVCVVRVLLDNASTINLDINKGCRAGASPLCLAAFKPCPETVLLLCSRRNVLLDMQVQDGNFKGSTALWIAAFQGCVRCVVALLNAGANFNIVQAHGGRYEGSTPLQIAAERGHTACVQELVVRGADLRRLKTVSLLQAHLDYSLAYRSLYVNEDKENREAQCRKKEAMAVMAAAFELCWWLRRRYQIPHEISCQYVAALWDNKPSTRQKQRMRRKRRRHEGMPSGPFFGDSSSGDSIGDSSSGDSIGDSSSGDGIGDSSSGDSDA